MSWDVPPAQDAKKCHPIMVTVEKQGGATRTFPPGIIFWRSKFIKVPQIWRPWTINLDSQGYRHFNLQSKIFVRVFSGLQLGCF